MSPTAGSEVLQALEGSRADVHAATDGVSEAQASKCPAPGRWSVLECVEHITITEGRFLSWLQNPVLEPAPPLDKQKETALAAGVSSRANRMQAPPPAHPTGRFATLAEALEQFDAARAKSIEFAKSTGPGLYSLAATHPFFGLLNGAELVLVMAAHSRRHAAQIREVRTTLTQ